MDTIDLGCAAVRGMLERYGVPFDAVQGIVWGGVILPSGAPNVAREIGLDLGLPHSVDAMTVSRACASGLQAITLAAAAIERGEADVVIAGGSDSTSASRLELPASLMQKVAPVALSKKSGVMDYLKLMGKISPRRDLIPKRPAIAERTTGELMGEACERMAERNEIAREDQDRLALASHQRAAAAIADGRFDGEVIAVETKRGTVRDDQIVRGDSSLERLAKLRAVFADGGTLTAGNSSTLTDGAGAVLLMSEEKAKELGLTPLAAVRSWSYVGVDPADQLLIGPALAMPDALDRAGKTLDEMDFVDIHEAFAAQVLSVTKMLASDAFAKERLGKDAAVGTVDPEKLNVHGGSIALGHPFAATGARMVHTMARAVHEKGAGSTALLGICAAGGIGAAAVLEAV
jgi:acetyl-CoA acyltransferase